MSAPAVTARSWTLTVPAPGEWRLKPGITHAQLAQGLTAKAYRAHPQWLTMNDRRHWRKERRIKKLWRNATLGAATLATDRDGNRVRLPVGEVKRCHVHGVLHFATSVRRDTHNWHPTAKVALDALTAGTRTHPGYGFLPDDEPLRYLHCEDCPHLRKAPARLEARPPFGLVGLLVLTLTEMPEELPCPTP